MRVDGMGIHVHQSDLKNFSNCGEQVRLLGLVQDEGRFETDAATVGTVTHALIEEELVNGFFDDEQGCRAWAARFFVETLERYQEENAIYSRSSFDTDLKALRAVERLATVWYDSPERSTLAVMPEGSYITEWDFDVPTGCRFRGMDVYWAGQADLLIFHQGLWDWKTASQAYKRWEKQRWDVQSTIYTFAAHREGYLDADKHGQFSMTFKVFDTRGSTPGPPDSVTVKRSAQNWAWTMHKTLNMLEIQAASPDGPWPLSDDHVLCSPKWCPVWDSCKGAFVSGETWL